MKQRIGILGGTFNPIHIGHLAIAQVAFEKLNLNHVVFVPSYLPPHKSGKNVLSAIERYQMVKLAISGHDNFSVSDCEIKKGGKSYSIDTVKYFSSQYSEGTKFFFIMGEDLYTTLPEWKQVDDIVKKVTFVVVNRPGFKKVKMNIKVRFITMPGLDVSSSYIRKRIALGKPTEYLVSEKVWNYITKKKLYLSK